ncbi:DNA/RNA helicase, superfamily I [Bernardetia litoralis DSM 6794]|uniref:DNA 3'-5' helicase n=1 Tax=Bernardetia litoralis (strain ATCC 23117 / DSM 6794 / NBRC 15988 / NCIMB 1366 / Fx l1 / Sio-4) TaxID=880071 RepID=I4AJ44_BERLS|nr:UvrD-helicase domain-containing protein [Bernardetia litoralis]AFM03979.1 DNA/RNA helicase, superfamily I [Bernardetia litoralis DSM 6794]
MPLQNNIKPNLTSQQESIIESEGDLKVEAVAGSGKTTALLEYAKKREGEGFMLYLAFNRAIKEEILRKLRLNNQNDIPTLWVETAHSLAYRSLFRKKTPPLIFDLSLSSIKNYFHLSDTDSTNSYLLARHTKNFFDAFCQSTHKKISDLDYCEKLTPRKGLSYVQKNYDQLERQVKWIFDKMSDTKIPITHDFYLKKYQLSNPKLSFDWILFDEGQDASPVMLDIFMNQEATKLIVGDEHQQIYGWRSAINSLSNTDFPSLNLQKSFRCPAAVTDYAKEVVAWKKHVFPDFNINDFEMIPRTVYSNQNNEEESNQKKTHAVIARTHLGLIQTAIEWLFEAKKVSSVAFEGNFEKYLQLDDGSSISQLVNLNNKASRKKEFWYDWKQIEETAAVSQDRSLKRLVELVKKYGNELPNLLERLQNRITEPHKADITFTTAHKGKGLEWDTVYLQSDFVSEKQILKAVETKTGKSISKARKQSINEEINILYVALTRAREEVRKI